MHLQGRLAQTGARRGGLGLKDRGTGVHRLLSSQPERVQRTLIHLRIQKEAAALKPERNMVFLWELEEIRGEKCIFWMKGPLIFKTQTIFPYQSPFKPRKSAEAASQANSLCFAD